MGKTNKIVKAGIARAELELAKRQADRYFADYTHWIKMSYWTLDEGVALLLGLNPKYTSWDLMKQFLDTPDTVSSDYLDLRDIVLRAQAAQKITDPVLPLIFIEWAASANIEIPADLQEQAAIMKNIKMPADAEKDDLLKERAMFQNKIKILEASVWQGFDETQSTYSKELAIAVKAHDAVSKNWRKGSSVKQQFWVWLEENYPGLLDSEKTRISVICNWQKEGGAPVTPSK
ncbi:MAG TPA: hypothetical protein VNK03_01695 [Gammaproteobacteria bacterium]|nr:hypothetical protein [Gammaproteobacteria bacterium]